MSNILLQLSKQPNGSNLIGVKPVSDVTKLTTTITSGRTVYNSGEQFYELKEMANKIIQQTNEKKVIAEEKEETIAVETNKLKEWEQTLVALSKEKILLESVCESSMERNLKIERLVTEAEGVVQKIKDITSFVEKQVLLGSARYQTLTQDYLETLQNRLSLVLERKAELMSRMQTEQLIFMQAIELLKLLNTKIDQIRSDINQNHHLLASTQKQVDDLCQEENTLKQRIEITSAKRDSTKQMMSEMEAHHLSVNKSIQDEKREVMEYTQSILNAEKRLSVIEQVDRFIGKSNIQDVADVCVVLETSTKIDQTFLSASDIQSLQHTNNLKEELEHKIIEMKKQSELALLSLSKEENELSHLQSTLGTNSEYIQSVVTELTKLEKLNASMRTENLELLSKSSRLTTQLEEKRQTISQIETNKIKDISSMHQEELYLNQQLCQLKTVLEKSLLDKNTLEKQESDITNQISEIQQQVFIENQECLRLRSMLELNQTTQKKRQEQNHKQLEEKKSKTKELMDTLSRLNLERQNLLKKGSTLASDLKNELESKQLECKLKLERKAIEKMEKRKLEKMEKYHKKQKNAIDHYTILLKAEEAKFQSEFSSIQQQVKILSEEEDQHIEANSNQSQTPTTSYYTPKKRNTRKRKQLSLEPVTSNPDTIDLFQDLA